MHIRRSFVRRLSGAGVAATLLMPVMISTAAGSAAPAIRAIEVRAGGTHATVTVATSEPARFSIRYQRAGAPVPANVLTGNLDLVQFPVGSVGSRTDGPAPDQRPLRTQQEFDLKPLQPNTTYDLFVTATTGTGQQISGRRQFTTLKQRVRLALDKITISGDGDFGGKGEPLWTWGVSWDGGSVGDCFPNAPGLEQQTVICQYGSFGEGEVFPKARNGQRLQLIFAQENFPVMPRSLSISADVDESDLSDLLPQLGLSYTPPSDVLSLRIPQDRESSVQRFTIETRHDSSGADHVSVMHFSLEVFYDNLAYPPNHTHPNVHSIY